MDNMQKHTLPVLAGLFLSLLTTLSQAAGVSGLTITEVMANPAAVSDSAGEWFELYNPGSAAVDLSDVVLRDDGSNSHTISSTSPLLVNPGDFFVLGRNGDSSVNGGYTPDYVYSGFSLGNSGDQIVLEDAFGSLRLDYGSGFTAAGQSSELLGLPMDGDHFGLTDAGLTYGLGDIGTPGYAGSFTPSAVPLPASAWLMLSGLVGMVGFQSRAGKLTA